MQDNFLEKWLDTIQCIDCSLGFKDIPDNSVDLILADPPYGISRELNCKNERLGTTAKLNFDFGKWDKFDKEWFEIAIKKTNGWIMTFSAKKDIGVYWDILEKNGFIAIDTLAWIKPDPLPLNAKTRFLSSWESIVVGKKSRAYWGSSYHPNILKFQAPKGKDRTHPTQKPLGLIKKLIELTTKTNGIVLDPFMGSGTTAVACKQLGRHFIGFEISKDFCEIAQKRLNGLNEELEIFT